MHSFLEKQAFEQLKKLNNLKLGLQRMVSVFGRNWGAYKTNTRKKASTLAVTNVYKLNLVLWFHLSQWLKYNFEDDGTVQISGPHHFFRGPLNIVLGPSKRFFV